MMQFDQKTKNIEEYAKYTNERYQAVFVHPHDPTQFYIFANSIIVYTSVLYSNDMIDYLTTPALFLQKADIGTHHIEGEPLATYMMRGKLKERFLSTDRKNFLLKRGAKPLLPKPEVISPVKISDVQVVEEERLDKKMPEFDISAGYTHVEHLSHEWKRMSNTDKKAFKLFSTFLANHHEMLGSFQKFNDGGLISLCLDDYFQMENALTQVEAYTPTRPELPDLTKASTAMSKIPQDAKERGVYVEILKPTIVSDGVYIAPHHDLTLIPLIKDKTTVDHAYINEIVQLQVRKHYAETGKTPSSSFDNVPLVEQILTKEQMDLFSNFQVITYKNNPHMIGVKLITHGMGAMAGRAEVIQDHPLSRLVQMLTKGLPPQYILIFAYGTDTDFKFKLDAVIDSVLTKANSVKHNIDLNLLFDAYSDYMQKIYFDGVPKNSGENQYLDMGVFETEVNNLVVEIRAVTRDLLVDRSTFGRFLKYFSMSISDAFLHRCINDLFAFDRDLVIMKAFDYVRTGHIIDVDHFSRNQFYEGEMVPIDAPLFQQFQFPENRRKKNNSLYWVDHTNLNLAPHMISNYEEDEEMVDERRDDKRARIFLDNTVATEKRSKQYQYVVKKMIEVSEYADRMSYESWYLGTIVPFIDFKYFDSATKAFVCLAPYPHIASFFVVFTNEDVELNIDIIPDMLHFKRTSLQMTHQSFMFGVFDFKDLTDKRLQVPSSPLCISWFALFKAQFKPLTSDKFKTFIHKEKVNRKQNDLKENQKMLAQKKNYDTLVLQKGEKKNLTLKEQLAILQDYLE